MASLRKKETSPYWFACFTLPDGTRTQRSTRVPHAGVAAADAEPLREFLETEVFKTKLPQNAQPKEMDAREARRLAERIAMQFEDAAIAGRTGRLIETQARKTIAHIYALANRDKLTSSTAADFFKAWLERKELEAGEKTHQKYAEVIGQFSAYLGSKVKQNIASITASDIGAFRDYLSQSKSPGTVNVAVKILRTAFASAFRDGLVDTNEASRVTTLKNSKKGSFRRQAFTKEQLKRILEAAGPEWKGMIMFGLYTGQRLGDIATLTWANLNLQNQTLTFTTAKTDREVPELPIAKPLLSYIENNIPAGDDPNAPLFPRICATRLRHKHAGNLSNEFYSILVKAGLATKKSHKADPAEKKGRGARRQQNPLSFHSLRHTATSLLKAAGVNEAVAMEFVGHDSVSVSRNYTHMPIETLKQAANKLPDITQ